MKNSPLTGKPDSSKLIYGSEALLIIFAAFLLIAATPARTINATAVPVKVNMPAPAPTTETLNTASVEISDDEQTTALLSLEVLPQKTATH